MEQLAVEVVCGPVIAQVQADDIESPLEQLLRERQDIEGFRAAFPPVQQHDRASCAQRVARHGERTGMEALKPHAIAAVEEHLPLRGHHRRRAARDRAATRSRTREHRLQMAVPQPAGRLEFFFRLRGHGDLGENLQCRRISMRLLAAAARFHSPAVSSVDA